MANPLAAAVALQERMDRRASFDGASEGRLFRDWSGGILPADREIQYHLAALRAHSRDLVRNNPYAAGFVESLADQIVGPEGIQLRAMVLGPDGSPLREVNWEIERGWIEWSVPEYASLDGCDSRVDLERLFIKSIATDGEVFIRRVRGADNPFGYALQIIDPDLVDETFDRPPDENGVEIRMGVEMDRNGRRLAYHVFKAHPADRWGRGRERVRIPAGEIIHRFIRYRPGQTRGYPWFAPVLTSMKTLGGLSDAELVAARMHASKMGFIVNKSQEAIEAYAARLAAGKAEPRTLKAAAGVIDELEPGQEFQGFDPTHPNSAFDPFTKVILRGVARGLGTSYATLTGDLTGANYSSMRTGLLPERDRYRALQIWMAQGIHRLVYRDWIDMALLKRAVRLPTRIPSDYYAVGWRPRGWKWVDPLKDLAAAELAIALGLDSRQHIAGEQGRDFYENVDDLQEEQEYAAVAGVYIGGGGGIERVRSSREGDDAGQGGRQTDDRDARTNRLHALMEVIRHD